MGLPEADIGGRRTPGGGGIGFPDADSIGPPGCGVPGGKPGRGAGGVPPGRRGADEPSGRISSPGARRPWAAGGVLAGPPGAGGLAAREGAAARSVPGGIGPAAPRPVRCSVGMPEAAARGAAVEAGVAARAAAVAEEPPAER